MNINKTRYSEWIKYCEDIPLFFQPWYLDAVSENGIWDVVISFYENNNVKGVLPYFGKKKYGITHITMPRLTPYLGPWFNYPKDSLKNTSRYQFEKKVIADLARQVPKHSLVKMHCHPEIRNILPFIWSGYKAQVRYTYCVGTSDEKRLWSDLDSKQRNIIQRAKDNIEVFESEDSDAFYDLNKESFDRNHSDIPYSKKFFLFLDKVLSEKQSRIILMAKDNKGRLHAAVYIVFDKRNAYCLAMGNNPQFKSSGAIAYVLWQAILRSFDRVPIFNFEGGMMPNIEQFFRSFGGVLTPYYSLYKSRNRLTQGVLQLLGKI